MEFTKLMKDSARKRFTIYLLVAAVILLFLISLGLLMTNKTIDPSKGEDFLKLDMTGSYSVEEEQWITFDSLDELPKDIKNITIKGNFKSFIDIGENLIVPIYGLRYKMFLNGVEIISFGQEGSYRFSHGPGYTIWYQDAYEIVGRIITPGDEVVIEIENVYYSTKPDLAYRCMENMAYGREIVFFRYVRKYAVEEIWGVLIITASLLVFAFSIIMFRSNPAQLQTGIAFSFFAFITGIYSLFRTIYGFLPLIIKNPVLCSYLNVFPVFFMVIGFTIYVLFNLHGTHTIAVMYVCTWMNVLCSVISFLCQLTGIRDLYEMQFFVMIPGFISIILGMICLVIDMLREKNKHSLLLFVLLIPFVVALIGSQIRPEKSADYIRYGIFLSSIFHLLEMIRFYLIQRKIEMEKLRMEKELTESRISVMQSQIKPHFLYNSLSTIQILCEKDPKLASEAVAHFSHYLRSNMDSLNQKCCIPFDHELHHIENYLFIEKLRFRDYLQVEYDIQVRDFMCPLLCLQPIVENAVKHGIGQKEEGGTIWIRTYEDELSYHICVEDDGVGFDWKVQEQTDVRSHVGLENTKMRLWELCKGTIEIDSKRGEGTRIHMRIPKE